MQRYFASKIDNKIVLSKEDKHHLLTVMRARINDAFVAIVDETEYLGQIKSIDPFVVEYTIQEKRDVELNKNTVLFFALAKGDKIDFVIQKATELGVSRIVLIKTERSIVKINNDDFIRKYTRYSTIAKEASQQSRRIKIPEIAGVYDVKKIPTEFLCDVNYVAYESEAGLSSKLNEISRANSISVLIGPEGGLSKTEIDSLMAQNFIPISLGKRILRTETAAVTALSVINYLVEQ